MSGKLLPFPNTNARIQELENEYLSLYEGLLMLEEELQKQRVLLQQLTSLLNQAVSSSSPNT